MTIDEETRSLSSENHPTKADQLPAANFSTTNNIFDLCGSTSLLVCSEQPKVGLFSHGDRFIPCRPENSLLYGEQKFRHEENLIISRQE